jgi:hypothetical protein
VLMILIWWGYQLMCRPEGQLPAADHPRPELGSYALRVVSGQRRDRPFLRV